MNKIKATSKKLWNDNKGSIAVSSTIVLIATAYVYGRHIAMTDNFLKEHNLFEEFYNLNE